mmetsp:Transcript_44541/g.123358  ORF Transcript_44541/g.123358 Transcript_44541/m.123358 type:complete len:83 (+) Transcript_44541:987-1235(+)
MATDGSESGKRQCVGPALGSAEGAQAPLHIRLHAAREGPSRGANTSQMHQQYEPHDERGITHGATSQKAAREPYAQGPRLEP